MRGVVSVSVETAVWQRPRVAETSDSEAWSRSLPPSGLRPRLQCKLHVQAPLLWGLQTHTALWLIFAYASSQADSSLQGQSRSCSAVSV